MKIRRYKGTNREELYRMIHKEMGSDAVVVAPESSGQGVFGRNRKYELIAILDEAQSHPTPNAKPASVTHTEDQPSGGDANTSRDQTSLTNDFRRWSRQQTHQWKHLQATVTEIQKTVETLQAVRASTPVPAAPAPVDDRPDHTRGWDQRFCEWARQEQPELLNANPAIAAMTMKDCLPVAEDFAFSNPKHKPHIVVLIGPTGSGKTTTLAKMAAICAHQQRLRVGIISIDTYRVAAVDQIREYASLLDMKLSIAFSADDARTAIREMSDMDVVFVDTPGRTHFDEIGLAVSHKLLRGLGSVTPLLTIPATLNPADLPEILHGFSRFDPHYLVVTKIDETRQPTLFTSLPFETDLQVAFTTNGQRVPQDILTGGAERIANLLFLSQPITPGAK